MCGACGAASAGSASMHWSTPFLGSVPARTAAARNLTAWARSTGSRLTVTGVASGFQVATASGRRHLAGDLGIVVDQLTDSGLGRRDLLSISVSAPTIEGPATTPPPRAVSQSLESSYGIERQAQTAEVRDLPPDPRRRYRLPALLAWLALADGTGALGTAGVEIHLGSGCGISLEFSDGAVVSCRVVTNTGADRVTISTSAESRRLLDLLG